jgi:protein LTV1
MQLANAEGNGSSYEGSGFEMDIHGDQYMNMPYESRVMPQENNRDGEGYNYDSDDLDDESDFDLESDFSDEETKTRFTNYSMTSSVIRRTQELQLLDDRFEKIEEEYDEEEMGCVDHEELAGMIRPDTDLFNQAIEKFIDEQTPHKLAEAYEDAESGDEKEKIGDEDDSEEESDEKLFAQFQKTPKAEWDCESIISTYSNIYNHPKMIPIEKKKITVSGKTGLPVGVLQKKEKNFEPEIEEKEVILNNKRNKGESAEERKQRKQAVKESRKNRRVEKKSNSKSFKNEQIKQEKLMTNVTSQQAIKL